MQNPVLPRARCLCTESWRKTESSRRLRLANVHGFCEFLHANWKTQTTTIQVNDIYLLKLEH